MEAQDLRETCDVLRLNIDAIATRLNGLKRHPELLSGKIPAEPRAEIFSNVTLAFRHLEDARMRIGKVIQHYEPHREHKNDP